jgi:hypothetical protein
MLRRELEFLIDHDKYDKSEGLKWNNNKSKEPVARFLKSYAVFVSNRRNDKACRIFRR